MKFDVIINPAGAGGKAAELWQKYAPRFSKCGITEHYSSPEDPLEAIARRLTSGGKEVFLLVIGGDGTINEVVNGINDFEHTRFAFLPCGSANDLALDLLGGMAAEDLIRTILKGEIVRDIDVGEVILHNEVNRANLLSGEIDPREYRSERTRRFNVSAGMGWDAEICEKVMFSEFKKPLNRMHLGKLVYIVEAVRTVFTMEKYHCTLTLDDETIDIPACMFNAVMNHRYEGGGFMFGPHAKNNDGLLDVCTAGGLSPLDFFCLFPLAYKGRHVGRREVFEHVSKNIRIQSDRPVWVHTDGEVLAQSTDISLHLLPGKLHLLF
jgi:YegS/Rv2252/BmrU family lipid kinase